MAALSESLLHVNPTANRQPEILRASIPFVVLTFVAVILRFWSRRIKRAAVAADDYMVLIGLVGVQNKALEHKLGLLGLLIKECSFSTPLTLYLHVLVCVPIEGDKDLMG